MNKYKVIWVCISHFYNISEPLVWLKHHHVNFLKEIFIKHTLKDRRVGVFLGMSNQEVYHFEIYSTEKLPKKKIICNSK